MGQPTDIGENPFSQAHSRCVPALARVHGVAVGQERLAAQLLDHVGHGLGVIWTKIADVAQLAEMQLDGHELSVHVDLPDPGLSDQLLELGGQPVSVGHRAKIGKINFRFLHFPSPLFPNELIAEDIAVHLTDRTSLHSLDPMPVVFTHGTEKIKARKGPRLPS